MTPDVNVLLAAFRTDHSHHAVARTWLESSLAACELGATFRMIPLVMTSFLRLVTSPKIFKVATPIDNAIAFIDALLATPGVEAATLGGEWPLLRKMCIEKKLRGNDLPDAWLAAAVIQLGEHLVTFDADFKRLLARRDVTVLALQPA